MTSHHPAGNRLFVAGIGPGDPKAMTVEALESLKQSDVIAGYDGYIRLLPPELLENRRIISTGMTREIERCGAAIDAALQGRTVTLVCSGDPGVYALAGLVISLIEKRGLAPGELCLEIIPGVPAVCAAAALAGAPLTHDFACVSLSDLLTPIEVIEKRLAAALSADFVLALYNPRSHKRTAPFETAFSLAMKLRGPDTPVAVVRAARREGQSVAFAPLRDIPAMEIDMSTILIIGNSATRIINGHGPDPRKPENGARMVTPRGYLNGKA